MKTIHIKIDQSCLDPAWRGYWFAEVIKGFFRGPITVELV